MKFSSSFSVGSASKVSAGWLGFRRYLVTKELETSWSETSVRVFFLLFFFFGRAACSLRETPSFAFGPLHLRWHLHTNKPVAGKSDSDAASTLLIYLLIIYLTSWSDMRPTRRRVSHWRMRLTRNSIKSSKYRQSIFGLLFPQKKTTQFSLISLWIDWNDSVINEISKN